MKKIGLISKKEVKFFTGSVLKASNVGGFLRTLLNWFLPGIINNIDDKYGDKIPEPWQTYIETLITKTYIVLQDSRVTVKEQEDLANYCSAILSSKIKIPGMRNDHKIQGIMILTQYAASQIRYLVVKKKENE